MELTILSPLGLLGYGIPKPSLRRAFEDFDIDTVAVDAGSIDPGPNYLGQGTFFADERVVARDLRLLLNTADEHGVPLLLSTAGGSGAAVHLKKVETIVQKIAREDELSLDVARIYTDVDRDLLHKCTETDCVQPLGHDQELTAEDIETAKRIVAQVGPQPFIDAYENEAEVILGGRAIDLAPFATVPLVKGFDPGLVFHLAKILECGTHATVSGEGADCLVGILRDDAFEVVPTNPEKRCTPESVAAHTLYEKADPHTIHLPHGEVDVSDAEFEAVSDRRVRVSGSRFEPADQTAILVEGVRQTGYRTITPAGVRDPAVIENLETITTGVRSQVADRADIDSEEYQLQFRVYGRDAVPLTSVTDDIEPNEVGVIIDVVGETQAIARSVCALARSTLLHYPFEGRVATGGNLALPYSPSDIEVGEVYEFSIYHLIQGASSSDIARIEQEELP